MSDFHPKPHRFLLTCSVYNGAELFGTGHMIYKAFAAVTLIAAPIIVLTVQSFVPQTNPPAAPAAFAPGVAPAEQPAPPPPTVSAPVTEPASFGQPVAEAGKPFLAPGVGLPAKAPTVQPVVEGVLPPPDGPPE